MAEIVELSAGQSAILVTEDGGVKKEVLVEGKGDLPNKFARCLGRFDLVLVMVVGTGGVYKHMCCAQTPQCTTRHGLLTMERCLWRPKRTQATVSQ